MPLYTEEDIIAALKDVAYGKSVRKAALDWGIPRSTIADRLRGAESSRAAAVEKQRLLPVQETHLTGWILTQEALGLAPTHAQIRELAQRILVLKGDTIPLGKNWLEGFFRRNPELKTKR